MGAGVSKSGSPAASRMTGIPAWTSEVARSLMTTVLEGLTALTRGLIEGSTGKSACEAFTERVFDCFPVRVLRRWDQKTVRRRNYPRSEIGGKKRRLTWEGKRGIWKRVERRAGIGSAKGFCIWQRYVECWPLATRTELNWTEENRKEIEKERDFERWVTERESWYGCVWLMRTKFLKAEEWRVVGRVRLFGRIGLRVKELVTLSQHFHKQFKLSLLPWYVLLLKKISIFILLFVYQLVTHNLGLNLLLIFVINIFVKNNWHNWIPYS